MPTSAPGPSDRRAGPAARPRRPRLGGFTLIELLITLVVIGIAVSLVVLNGLPNERQGLRFEAERLAQLLALAREEAQVRGAPLRWHADEQGYRFLWLRDRQWRLIQDDAELRERPWQAPTTIRLSRADGRREIEFGRDPVDSPFLLDLAREGGVVRLRADGLGRFEVLP